MSIGERPRMPTSNAAAAQPVGERTGAVGDEPLLFGCSRRCESPSEPVLSREVGRRAKESIRNRVWRVRRDADADERRFEIAKPGDLLAQSGDRRLALRRIGTEHFLVDDAAHARFAHRPHDDAGIARVGVRGDAGAQSLLDAVARRIEQRVACRARRGEPR